MSLLSQIILCSSFSCVIICLIIQYWIVSSSLPFYLPVAWAVIVTILSTWISCIVLKCSLKANSPLKLQPVSLWLRRKVEQYLNSDFDLNEKHLSSNSSNAKDNTETDEGTFNKPSMVKPTHNHKQTAEHLGKKITSEIDTKYIQTWYKNISDDEKFSVEARNMMLKLSLGLNNRIEAVDKIRLVNKLTGVLLVHLKEYRRALRRVEKGNAATVEEAYHYAHPGSRSSSALEHTLGRLVTVIAREFLQWDLGSSLPCKLLLSILAKRLLTTLETMSSPMWILQYLIHRLNFSRTAKQTIQIVLLSTAKEAGAVPSALSDGIASATAAAIAQPLTKPNFIQLPEVRIEDEDIAVFDNEKSSLSLTVPLSAAGHRRGLWDNTSEIDAEIDEDKISPVYEETTDFASTIARLRNLLQQKSTATTPLQAEEKSYVIYEESQFTNLAIPWTEFYTATDGSQQLLYCIQFDDVEQHGVDTFETTTATVRRQYFDFVQLHSNLEEIPSLSGIMAEIILPDGGRVEMENYLRTLCARLGNETPTLLRRFLRPSSGAGKKADVVAPRLDRFLAKTVSGVFNTLKTVVPGFEMDQQEDDNNVPLLPTLMPLADIPWRFVQDINKSKNLAIDLCQLVADRTDYCSVDTAYEAVDSVEGSGDSELLAHWWEIMNTNCDEELDELDSNLSLTCAGIDLACEILAGVKSNNAFQQEAVVRWFKLLLGNVTEPLLQDIVCWTYDRFEILPISSIASRDKGEDSEELLRIKLLLMLQENIPSFVKLVFGEGDTKDMIKFVIGSLEAKKVNKDLHLQIFDVIASEILASCRLNYHKG